MPPVYITGRVQEPVVPPGAMEAPGTRGAGVTMPELMAKGPEEHHFATNKGKYASHLQKIVDPFGLHLDEPWNKKRVPGHSGRHTDAYHMFVHFAILQATSEATNAAEFVRLFEYYVKAVVRENPKILYKDK